MPRRENRGEGATLRPPVARAKQGNAGSAGRNNPYQGNAAFASSSSSSLNALGRTLDWNDSNALGVGVMSSAGAATGLAEAPFLATAESHLGRMTLTAPDNMRRKKAEEKEKKRNARKAKVERLESSAAQAAAALLTQEERRSVSPTQRMMANTLSPAETASGRRRPAIPVTRSSSNLQTLRAVEVQRSRSPTRPPRPRSAQNAARSDTSPERRAGANANTQQRRAQRRRGQAAPTSSRHAFGGEQGGTRSRQLSRSSSTADQSAGEEQSAVRAEALRRATRRRRDIYADLSSMNLPGMSDSDSEDTPPPPFPQNATRPLSPPPMPVEGQEWTEAMRRRQEEYLDNLPPNSPPPAFLSEEEGSQPAAVRQDDAHTGTHSNESNSGVSEGEAEECDEDRRMWAADVAAGFSFEERLQRECARREQKTRQEEERVGDRSGIGVEALPNLNLGQLVVEARARREAAQTPDDEAKTEETSDPRAEAFASPQNHRRTASDGTVGRSEAPVKPTRNLNAAIGTGKGLMEGSSHRTISDSRGTPTKIRPRPSSDSQSRFRDAASAAAARRQAVWESMRDGMAVPSAYVASSSSLPIQQVKDVAHVASPMVRKDTTSSNGASEVETDRESSDSEDEWQKEENRFLEIQRGPAKKAEAIESSDEEEDTMQVPGSMPRRRTMADLPELGRVGRSVPRAPPPLVLGRSRGGAAYSSSSESSNSSEERRARDEAEETDSDSPVEPEDFAPSDLDRFSDMNGRLDKGKQPQRSPPSLGRESSVGAPTSSPERAGVFVEDDASSRDVSADEVDLPVPSQKDATIRRASEERDRVQQRLRGLFATQLSNGRDAKVNGETLYTDSTSSSSKMILQGKAQVQPRQSSFSRIPSGEKPLPPPRQPLDSPHPPRDDQRHPSLTAEQARAEALKSISQVQKSRDRLPDGVDRDSLAALERMLTRSGAYAHPRGATDAGVDQPLASEPSKLTRSGAIGNRQMSSSAFVNPRTVNAPRPLGRLPTITDATRHFPPSQERPGDVSSADRPERNVRPLPRSSATPSWMAYVPAAERRALPDPIEPDVRLSEPVSARSSPNVGTGGGGRVSAMIQRFEHQRPVSGVATASSPVSEQPRRRPPPPPPHSSWRRAEEVLNASNAPGLDDPLPSVGLGAPSRSVASQLPAAPPSRQTTDVGEASSSSLSPAVSIFGNLYTAEEITRSSNDLFRASRPLPIPPHFDPSAVTFAPAQASAARIQAPDLQESPTIDSPLEGQSSEDRHAVEEQPEPTTEVTRSVPRRDPSLGITDLDVFASRLADTRAANEQDGQADAGEDGAQGGDQYDDLHLLAEFLGPAKQPGLNPDEMEALPVGRVEVLRRRIVGKREDGRDKVKLVLAVAGVKVERCAVCLVQFKQDNLACVFPCLHVLHEQCASKLLRNTTLCPTCRTSVVERQEEG